MADFLPSAILSDEAQFARGELNAELLLANMHPLCKAPQLAESNSAFDKLKEIEVQSEVNKQDTKLWGTF